MSIHKTFDITQPQNFPPPHQPDVDTTSRSFHKKLNRCYAPRDSCFKQGQRRFVPDNRQIDFVAHLIYQGGPKSASPTVKPVLSSHSKRGQNIGFKADHRIMKVKSMQNALLEHSAILLTFIKLPSVFKTFVLSIFEWPLKTGFTVLASPELID